MTIAVEEVLSLSYSYTELMRGLGDLRFADHVLPELLVLRLCLCGSRINASPPLGTA